MCLQAPSEHELGKFARAAADLRRVWSQSSNFSTTIRASAEQYYIPLRPSEFAALSMSRDL